MSRAPLEESRKWGLYYTTNLLFKTYFKLNSIGLSKNILRALSASRTDMPVLEAFPRSHIVTFKYYVGVIQFLEEDYAQAEENLTSAWHMCHRSATRNIELILTYLIPTLLLTRQQLPSPRLLSPYPRLGSLFAPLTLAIRIGSLSAFDTALAEGEHEFVKRRIYLTLERGRDICLRNLLRKVYLAGDLDEEGKRNTRIYIKDFTAAISLDESGGSGGSTDVEMDGCAGENIDEVECLVANMIYKVGQSPIPTLAKASPLTSSTESNERLHLPRARHRRPLQERRLPRHRHLRAPLAPHNPPLFSSLPTFTTMPPRSNFQGPLLIKLTYRDSFAGTRHQGIPPPFPIAACRGIPSTFRQLLPRNRAKPGDLTHKNHESTPAHPS